MSSRAAVTMTLVLAFHPAIPAQSSGSIQGVWRPVSRTIPATDEPRRSVGSVCSCAGRNPDQPAARADDLHRQALQQDDGHCDGAASNNPGSYAGKGDGRGTPGTMGTVPGQRRHLRTVREHVDAAPDGVEESGGPAERQLRPPLRQDGRRPAVAHTHRERGRPHRGRRDDRVREGRVILRLRSARRVRSPGVLRQCLPAGTCA